MANLVTDTFEGFPGGMNVAEPPQDIDDTEAQYLQDALVALPGVTQRRGPVRELSGIAQPTRKTTGIVSTVDPAGTGRFGVLNGDNSNGYLSIYSNDLAALVDVPWPHSLPSAPSSSQFYRLVDSKPALTGGAFIGDSSMYELGSGITQALAVWMGGNKTDYTTGTVTTTRGSSTVTGAGTSWSTTGAPGMFLFASTDDGYTSTLIGTVKSVDSNTQVTLTSPSPYPLTGKTYALKSLRGVYPRVTTGRITCDTGGATVNGGNTKFRAQGLGTGSWNIYRSQDWTWVGKVSLVANDASLTLAANAAIALADEAYIAIRADGDWNLTNNTAAKPGWITAQYAGRQWYFNNASRADRTWELSYSGTDDPEDLDLSDDGNWFPVGSQSVFQEAGRGLVATSNALLAFKENETFAVYGSSPSQFELKKLADDGALSGMSIQAFGGGAMWAGRNGVYFYDGVEVLNLLEDKFGDVWANSLRTFDPSRYRMYSMLARNHYFLYIEQLTPTIQPIHGSFPTAPHSWVLAINLATKAPTLMTNVGIRGAITLPATEGERTWYVVNSASDGHVCSADDLFDTEGIDTITCDGETIGPAFYVDTKKFNAGDSLRLKKFKTLLMHYVAEGGVLKVDIVLGLNEFGKTLTTPFPESKMTWARLDAEFSTWDDVADRFLTWESLLRAVFDVKRIKFQKQSQHMSFRVWQSNSTMTRVRLGPFQIGLKILRAGRV